MTDNIDTSVPHPARRYNYWLGGKDNFAADRASGDAIAEAFPSIVIAARANRDFMRRAVTYLARDEQIRQFLDIGTGLPAPGNTHEVAQSIESASRIVYVDNDPLVLSHARALLTGTPTGATTYIDADLREPDRIVGEPELKDTLDLSRPTALLLGAILHFIPDDAQAYDAVDTLVRALPAGSFLVLSHATYDLMDTGTLAKLDTTLKRTPAGQFRARTRAQIDGFFAGLELVEPGLRIVSEWRPDLCAAAPPPPPPQQVAIYGAVARKPS